MLAALAFAAALAAPPDPRAMWFAAAREGRTDVIEALAEAGAPVNARDERGYTAVILAAYAGRREAVRRLIARGADACIGDAEGNTALMGAAFKGDEATARLLLDAAPCPVDQTNRRGQTALMTASLFGREAIAALLLARGASPTRPAADGATAAGLAEAQGAAGILSLFRSAADPGLQSRQR